MSSSVCTLVFTLVTLSQKSLFIPTVHLLSFQFATDFHEALVNITFGIMLPADLLAHTIVGLVLEDLDMECLVH
jgi:hypothetical protein